MNSACRVVGAVAVLLSSGQATFAQDVSRYRGYVLESTLASVIVASGARATEAKTLHERPAKIQELEWRAPYAGVGNELADPVRDIGFTFVDDALYQIVIGYDRNRTVGLTNHDIITTLTSTYGAPVGRSATTAAVRPAAAYPDTIVLAQWDTAAASLTLVRGAYTAEFQLILVSKALSTRARNAIREAHRLDAVEAPRRESDQRKKDAAEASATREKARATNKAAFRPLFVAGARLTAR
jgi:hypothetical protein